MASSWLSASVSVIVVSHNEGQNLRRTLDNLLATTPADSEIIVVDDASTDGSADNLAGDDARLVVLRPAERMGVARARNFGAHHARHDVLVFSDAHVETTAGWTARLLHTLERPEVGAAGPAISMLGARRSKGYGLCWSDMTLNSKWLGRQGTNPYPVPMLCACFVALRREVFAAIGGFDPGLKVWGSCDADLSLHLWMRGYECLLVPTVEVAHLFRTKHPYMVDWETILHNKLRLGIVYFGLDRLRRLVACHAAHPAFPAAFARLAEGDSWARRDAIRSARRYDDEWFFQRFQMP